MPRYAAVTLLKRVLYLQAAANALFSVLAVTAPRFLLVTLLGQPAYVDYAWIRLVGVQDLVLAMLIVLVAQRIEEMWWWSWAFVVMAFGTAAIMTLHALIGLPPAAAAWPWWAGGLFSWLIAFGLLRGIAGAGVEAERE